MVFTKQPRMKDALIFKLDNTHYINSLIDDVFVCMFPFLHCLLKRIVAFQYVLTIWVRGIARSLVDKNPTTMSNLILIKNISNIWRPYWGFMLLNLK
jgi:hypothetical protein